MYRCMDNEECVRLYWSSIYGIQFRTDTLSKRPGWLKTHILEMYEHIIVHAGCVFVYKIYIEPCLARFMFCSHCVKPAPIYTDLVPNEPETQLGFGHIFNAA